MAIQEKQKIVVRPQRRMYSDYELSIFEREIEKYKNKKRLRNDEEVNVTDFIKFYEDQGAIRTDENDLYIRNAIKYLELQEKVSQFCSYSARREYGQKMRLEGLDTLAGQMKIN